LKSLVESAAARDDVGFNPENRLDACFLRSLVEFERAEHYPVICESHSRHLVLDSGFYEAFDTRGGIEEAVVGMIVEMNEL
jgi:hypothetical protein